MKFTKVLFVVLGLLIFVSFPALAVAEFQITAGFNSFSDPRVKGQDSSFAILFDLNNLKVGYFNEQGKYSVVDDTTATNYFHLISSVSGLRLLCTVADFKMGEQTELGADFGFDLGSMQLTGIDGSYTAPTALNQNLPIIDALVNLNYDGGSGQVKTGVFLTVGYRFASLWTVETPFDGTTRNMDAMNTFFYKLGVSVKI